MAGKRRTRTGSRAQTNSRRSAGSRAQANGRRSTGNRRRRKRRGGGKTRIISTVILIVCLAVFLFAGYKLISIFREYNKGDSNYDDLQSFLEVPDDSGDAEDIYIDFEGLLKENSDLAAWIRIGGNINISYPVMQSDDNDFYLRRLFNKTQNILGSIFMDYRCNADLTDENTIIYGHNTKNGSMFGGLKEWKEKEEYDNNPYFYIYTPDGMVHEYQVCAVVVTDDQADDYRIEFEDSDDFLSWEKEIQESSLYDTGVELDENSQIVTLSTCTNRTDSERLIVHGVKTGTRECKK